MVNCLTLIFAHSLRKQVELTHQNVDIVTKGSDADSIKSCSGPARTHDVLANTKPIKVGPRVAHTEQFVCKGGVDAGRLLNLSRKGLYSIAKEMGGNVLLEEQWDCKIRYPRIQKRDEFKVTIHYAATVARSAWPDAQRPVDIEAVKGIRGLMTVLDRHADPIC
ncbi:hypothetical protein PAXINDRAFT_93980 [Paxillus involutus ATCC 200175]|uniref:Uncharacterized protein n=1 Tax=Paxillus involutus ATCC 200175 TaxID=664439 RepID=A0A0C9SLU4_PAXIN|nr:hypothetical protein PAXINDRAFT_93980 [Paxillus involutus ATCC 200175]